MRTGLAFIILTTTLAACTAQTAPAPTEIPSTLPPITTPTMQPSATTCPTAVPTVTPTPLSPDAQALKDIVFSDCIPVEESLPEGFEIPWNLLVKQIGSAYIVNPEDDTKIEIPYFSEKAPDGSYKFTYEFYVSPDGKWLAYQDISREKLIVEPTGTLLTNKDSDRIVWDKGNWFSIKRWVDNDTIFALYQPPEDTWFYPTVFLNPFTREEYVFLLQDMPN